MPLIGSSTALLEALPEPALIVQGDGSLVHVNRPAARLFGCRAPGRTLPDWVDGELMRTEAFLQRCLGAAAPLLGALTLRTATGPERVQCRGARIALSPPSILLRVTRTDEQRFRALSTKVAELDVEVAQRRHTEAFLQETLREKELLLRELQHRVKNNMQMLVGMLLGAAREAANSEAKAALKDAATRFSAVGAVQQLLYGAEHFDTVGSVRLMGALLDAASGLGTSPIETVEKIDAVELSIEAAVPLALILNELLTNTIKHGKPSEGPHRIRVGFSAGPDTMRLEVQDNGPGLGATDGAKRASGLGLVRGLLRQLGGRLDIDGSVGTHCVATFPVPRDAAVQP